MKSASSSSTDSSASQLNPFLLLMMVIMIAGAIFALNKVSIWFAPAFLIASVTGMTVLATVHHRDQKREQQQLSSVDYKRLTSTNISKYAPWLKENIRGQDEV